MGTFIGNGAAELQQEHDSKRRVEKAERFRQTQEIIKHVEKATGMKAIEVDGELKYIPLTEAKKLGLL